MSAAEVNFGSLSLEEKLTHKDWKARSEGYDLILKDESKGVLDNETLSILLDNIVNMIGDPIAPAQEKALDIFIAFSEQIIHNSNIAPKVSQMVIKKCLGNKPKIKEKGMKVLIKLAEYEKYNDLTEPIIDTGLKNSNPKIVSGTIESLNELLVSFGPQVIDLKLLAKSLCSLSEHRVANVRDLNKILISQIYFWFGEGSKTHFNKLKQLFLNEVDSEYEKIKENKKIPVLKFFSQRDQSSGSDTKSDAESNEKNLESDDNDEICNDSSDKINYDPYTDAITSSSNWKERKEALEMLLKASDTLKIDRNNETVELVGNLAAIVDKDNNVAVATLATQCLKQIFSGLRNNYTVHIEILPNIASRFKEKKVNLINITISCILEMFKYSSKQEQFFCTISNIAKKSTNPVFKSNCLECTINLLQNMTTNYLNDHQFIKGNIPSFISFTSDSNKDVREKSFIVMGYVMALSNEKHLHEYITKIDDIKMNKIKDCLEKIEIPSKLKRKKEKPNVQPKKKDLLKSNSQVENTQSKQNKQLTQKKSNNEVSNNKVAEVSNLKKSQNSTAKDFDINNFITSHELITNCDSANPEVKLNNLELLQEKLNSTKKEISSNAIGIFDVLCRRIAESNKKTVIISLNILSTIVSRVSAKNKYISQLFYPLVNCLGDSKLPIRSKAVDALNELISSENFNLIKSDMLSSVLRTENKNQLNE
ncbi:MAG: hypothetical protein MHPSP_000543, partial [Paramarteilia canceri]